MEKLPVCGETPNCICSQDSRNKFSIKSLKGSSSIEDDKKKLKKICFDLGAELLEENKNYLHFLFKTRVFRFKDDVEFLLTKNSIEMRSSSRIGHYDFKANKKRLEKISSLFIS